MKTSNQCSLGVEVPRKHGTVESTGFPGGASDKEPNAGDIRDTGSIPGSGRSPGGGNEDPLQYSCLENPKDRETWQTTVHRVAKSRTSGPIPCVCVCVCVCFGKSPRFYIVIYYILMSVYLRFP